jgi:hypothetical protein
VKRILTVVVLARFANAAFSAGLDMNHLGHPFRAPDLDISWNAPASTLPSALWVYRVLPSRFSPSVISNMMALGPFTAKDRTNPWQRPPYNNPGTLFFAHPSERKTLGFYPHGLIEYMDELANDINIGEGVPNDAEAVRLGTNYLQQLGIGLSQLAATPNGSELRVWHGNGTAFLSMPNHVIVTNVHLREVRFIRRLDGVDFDGDGTQGGCAIQFGHHAKVSQITLLWRDLQRDRLDKTATPELLMKWMREGRGAWRASSHEWQDINPAWIKKMTVSKVTPYYYGENEMVAQQWVYPFAKLDTTMELCVTNYRLEVIRTNLAVRVCCPIIDEKQVPR